MHANWLTQLANVHYGHATRDAGLYLRRFHFVSGFKVPPNAASVESYRAASAGDSWNHKFVFVKNNTHFHHSDLVKQLQPSHASGKSAFCFQKSLSPIALSDTVVS